MLEELAARDDAGRSGQCERAALLVDKRLLAASVPPQLDRMLELAPNAGSPDASLLPDRHQREFVLQIRYALLDQRTMMLPLQQGLLKENDQAFGLGRIVTGSLQVEQQLLLVAEAFGAFLDIGICLEQKAPLDPELLGTLSKRYRHGTV
jgi:hypothetical protein